MERYPPQYLHLKLIASLANRLYSIFVVFSIIVQFRGKRYIFRHTFATMFLANGGSDIALKEIMGHESFQTTQKYIHFQPQDLKKQHMKYSPVVEIFGE